jgi:lysophospholipid acyltransferase (LPLAT)-like uncharacterized protein
MLKRLLRRPAAQALLEMLIAQYLAFALRTTRWTLVGGDRVAPFLAGRPAVVAFWHECLPLMPALVRLARKQAPTIKIYALVSRHADGRFLGGLLRRFGVEIVHGSTGRDGRERGGTASVRALVDRLAAGSHVAITPDGPRGPRRQAAPGVAHVAGLAGVQVLPCAAQTSRKLVLRSWDRMVVPLPFGRGTIVFGDAISVPRDGWDAALPQIGTALTAAADAADRRCG